MSDTKPQVLVLGHSFISRLESAFHEGTPLLNMDIAQCKVKMHGRPGGSTLDTLNYDVLPKNSVVQHFQPQVVVLQVGGNCLSSLEAPEVEEHIIQLVETLLQLCFVHRVVVLQTFPRPKPCYISPEIYEERRQELNTAVASRLQKPDLQHKALSWDIKTLENSALSIFDNDGVHLSNHVGIPLYWEVIRSAIIDATKDL